MPIKGISDKRQFPRSGKIRLGIKKEKQGGSTYPSATDYFICPPEVKEVFGEEPTELTIMFPVEDEKRFASQWLKCYSLTRGLVCKGDGETATAYIDKKTGEIANKDSGDVEMREVECNPDTCPKYAAKQCRPIMTLLFLLPNVSGLGVWQINTSSFHSIRNINSCIDLIRGVCGHIAMVPLTLALVPQEVQPEGKRKTVRVLTLKINDSISQLAAAGHGQPLVGLLPNPDDERPDDLIPDEVCDDGANEADELFDDLEAASDRDEVGEQAPLYNMSPVENLGDLFKRAYDTFRLSPAEALAAIGVSNKGDIPVSKLDEAWQQIVAVKGEQR